MKNLLLAILILSALPSFATGGKRALIVAVVTYQPETKWANLSTANDVTLIKEALILRGFKAEDIHVLTSGITKESILKAIDDYLIKPSEPGDAAVFHYSGHGQQVQDRNGDETDGLDEALVPEDAPKKNYTLDAKGARVPYKGDRHLTDDELGAKLDELRTKLTATGNVMVIIDACHSGTATRGLSVARGTMEANVSNDFDPTKSAKITDSSFGFGKAGNGKASMACFFGASQSELNFEYHPDENTGYGSLSFAISKVLAETPPNVSYRVLFDKVRNEMATIAPKQTPQVEGEIDQEVLGGNLLPRPQNMAVKEWISAKEVKINAGKLMALYPGSIVAFYPPDTRELAGETPIATGKVVSSRTADALVVLTEGTMDKTTATNSWCYTLERNFGDMSVKVNLVCDNAAQKEQFTKAFAGYPFIQLTDKDANLLLECGTIEGKKKPEIRLTTDKDQIRYSDKLNVVTVTADKKATTIAQTQVDSIIKLVIGYTQARFLRGMDVKNPDMKASLNLVPLSLKPGASGKDPYNDYVVLDTSAIYKNGVIVVPDGMYMRVEVKNESTKKLYFSVIDIMPSDELFILYPKPGRSAEEYMVNGLGINANETAVFKIGPPYGNDMLKLVVSTQKLDLASIAISRGDESTKGTGSSFEKLFQNSYKTGENSRGPESVPVEVEDIGVYTLVYTIQPPPQ